MMDRLASARLLLLPLLLLLLAAAAGTALGAGGGPPEMAAGYPSAEATADGAVLRLLAVAGGGGAVDAHVLLLGEGDPEPLDGAEVVAYKLPAAARRTERLASGEERAVRLEGFPVGAAMAAFVALETASGGVQPALYRAAFVVGDDLPDADGGGDDDGGLGYGDADDGGCSLGYGNGADGVWMADDYPGAEGVTARAAELHVLVEGAAGPTRVHVAVLLADDAAPATAAEVARAAAGQGPPFAVAASNTTEAAPCVDTAVPLAPLEPRVEYIAWVALEELGDDGAGLVESVYAVTFLTEADPDAGDAPRFAPGYPAGRAGGVAGEAPSGAAVVAVALDGVQEGAPVRVRAVIVARDAEPPAGPAGVAGLAGVCGAPCEISEEIGAEEAALGARDYAVTGLEPDTEYVAYASLEDAASGEVYAGLGEAPFRTEPEGGDGGGDGGGGAPGALLAGGYPAVTSVSESTAEVELRLATLGGDDAVWVDLYVARGCLVGDEAPANASALLGAETGVEYAASGEVTLLGDPGAGGGGFELAWSNATTYTLAATFLEPNTNYTAFAVLSSADGTVAEALAPGRCFRTLLDDGAGGDGGADGDGACGDAGGEPWDAFVADGYPVIQAPGATFVLVDVALVAGPGSGPVDVVVLAVPAAAPAPASGSEALRLVANGTAASSAVAHLSADEAVSGGAFEVRVARLEPGAAYVTYAAVRSPDGCRVQEMLPAGEAFRTAAAWDGELAPGYPRVPRRTADAAEVEVLLADGSAVAGGQVLVSVLVLDAAAPAPANASEARAAAGDPGARAAFGSASVNETEAALVVLVGVDGLEPSRDYVAYVFLDAPGDGSEGTRLYSKEFRTADADADADADGPPPAVALEGDPEPEAASDRAVFRMRLAGATGVTEVHLVVLGAEEPAPPNGSAVLAAAAAGAPHNSAILTEEEAGAGAFEVAVAGLEPERNYVAYVALGSGEWVGDEVWRAPFATAAPEWHASVRDGFPRVRNATDSEVTLEVRLANATGGDTVVHALFFLAGGDGGGDGGGGGDGPPAASANGSAVLDLAGEAAAHVEATAPAEAGANATVLLVARNLAASSDYVVVVVLASPGGGVLPRTFRGDAGTLPVPPGDGSAWGASMAAGYPRVRNETATGAVVVVALANATEGAGNTSVYVLVFTPEEAAALAGNASRALDEAARAEATGDAIVPEGAAAANETAVPVQGLLPGTNYTALVVLAGPGDAAPRGAASAVALVTRPDDGDGDGDGGASAVRVADHYPRLLNATAHGAAIGVALANATGNTTVHLVVLRDGDGDAGPPATGAEALAAAGSAAAVAAVVVTEAGAADETVLLADGLNASTPYTAYVVLWPAGAEGPAEELAQLGFGTAPAWGARVANATLGGAAPDTAVIEVLLEDAAAGDTLVHVVALPRGAAAPPATGAEALALVAEPGARHAEVRVDAGAAAAGPVEVELDGLNASTAYAAYVVLEEPAEGELSAVPVAVDFETPDGGGGDDDGDADAAWLAVAVDEAALAPANLTSEGAEVLVPLRNATDGLALAVHVLALDAAAPAPADGRAALDAVLAGEAAAHGVAFVNGSAEARVALAGLAPGTNYTAYVVLERVASGEVRAGPPPSVRFATLPAPAELEVATFSVESEEPGEVTLAVRATRATDVAFVLLREGAPAPSADDVRAGTDGEGAAAAASGTFAAGGDGLTGARDVRGLAPGTYDALAVAAPGGELVAGPTPVAVRARPPHASVRLETDGAALRFRVSMDRAGSFSYVVLADGWAAAGGGAAAPTAAEVVNGTAPGGGAPAAAGSVAVPEVARYFDETAAGLAAGVNYTMFGVAVGEDGVREEVPAVWTGLVLPDLAAPEFETGFPAPLPAAATLSSVAVEVRLTEAGDVFALAVEADAAAPAPARVLDEGAATPVDEAGAATVVNVTGLGAGRSYDVYLVAVDRAEPPNAGASARAVPHLATLEPPEAPREPVAVALAVLPGAAAGIEVAVRYEFDPSGGAAAPSRVRVRYAAEEFRRASSRVLEFAVPPESVDTGRGVFAAEFQLVAPDILPGVPYHFEAAVGRPAGGGRAGAVEWGPARASEPAYLAVPTPVASRDLAARITLTMRHGGAERLAARFGGASNRMTSQLRADLAQVVDLSLQQRADAFVWPEPPASVTFEIRPASGGGDDDDDDDALSSTELAERVRLYVTDASRRSEGVVLGETNAVGELVVEARCGGSHGSRFSAECLPDAGQGGGDGDGDDGPLSAGYYRKHLYVAVAAGTLFLVLAVALYCRCCRRRGPRPSRKRGGGSSFGHLDEETGDGAGGSGSAAGDDLELEPLGEFEEPAEESTYYL